MNISLPWGTGLGRKYTWSVGIGCKGSILAWAWSLHKMWALSGCEATMVNVGSIAQAGGRNQGICWHSQRSLPYDDETSDAVASE